jgi:hypothetical protein
MERLALAAASSQAFFITVDASVMHLVRVESRYIEKHTPVSAHFHVTLESNG